MATCWPAPCAAVDWSRTDSFTSRDRHHHGCVIARSDIGEYDALGDAIRDRARREDVIDAPADVALAHVPPRRPPGEELRIGGLARPPHVDEMLAEKPVEELPFLRALPDDARLALARMDVDLRVRDVEVAAQDHGAPVRVQRLGPSGEPR